MLLRTMPSSFLDLMMKTRTVGLAARMSLDQPRATVTPEVL